ncbi:uncharacterized protein LOC111593958 [Drosophila hydei]|uniref:Uncharacterized protein LOC111593958 n=1 Tax=Drosophila hydei TaxID=7224 RepID=A0A6J1LC77_DROHY|nr:uncharacterized protein LOC111593958 [Drosophila hydei]
MKATVKFTNIKCGSYNETLVKVEQCRLRAISRSKTVLNIALNLLVPVNNMKLHWQTKVWGNGYKPWLAEYKIDFCAFLRRANHPAVKILYDAFKPFTNLNHTCPLVGNIYVKDMFWDVSNYTLPMPTGDYLIILNWVTSNKTRVFTNVYLSFKQDLISD